MTGPGPVEAMVYFLLAVAAEPNYYNRRDSDTQSGKTKPRKQLDQALYLGTLDKIIEFTNIALIII